jgi:lysozyme
MRRLAASAILLVLTACTSVSYDFADLVPVSSTNGNPRFRDSDPHDWQGTTPWHYPIHGTDVAKYQGEVNWRKVSRNDISFAYLKATEGGDIVDDYFRENWREAKAAGIPRGAYHFYYFCRPAIEQAAWYIRNVPRDPNALPPVLDMEWNPASPTCKKRPPAEIVRAEMKVFLEALRAHYGKNPIIYTTIDFYEDNGLWRFKGYPFWLRSVAGHPDDKYDGMAWLFWQYTGTGVIPGVEGDVDINVFHGSENAWENWLSANTG